MLPLFDHL